MTITPATHALVAAVVSEHAILSKNLLIALR